MLEAKSMYLGGEIIHASQCDYESPRKLGLVCPFCNAALFVRGESVRRVKGREIPFSPYFAHYPSGSNPSDCDRRSYSKEGKERITKLRIQAKNQRLDLYNRHLWEMANVHLGMSHQKLNQVRKAFGQQWLERTSTLVRHEWGERIDMVYQAIESSYLDMKRIQKDADAYLATCDGQLHVSICQEVADFLSTNTAGYVFLKLFKSSLYLSCDYMDPAKLRQLQPSSQVWAIAISIAAVPWIEQINQRLGDPCLLK